MAEKGPGRGAVASRSIKSSHFVERCAGLPPVPYDPSVSEHLRETPLRVLNLTLQLVERTEIVKRIKPYVEEVSMTTNASKLKNKACLLQEAGLARVNVSLHSLNPLKFIKITGKENENEVQEGIKEAVASFKEKKPGYFESEDIDGKQRTIISDKKPGLTKKVKEDWKSMSKEKKIEHGLKK